MSDTRTAPAGWYQDPSGGGGHRWWDGSQWTDHLAEAAAAAQIEPAPGSTAAVYAPYGAASSTVPAGTPTDTAWIWLIVALPALSVIPFYLWDAEAYLTQSLMSPADGLAQLALYTDTWYVTGIVLGLLVYPVTVWFAYLDRAALARLGYERRFHWAWALLSWLVYVIGRSVVVRKQAGRGFGPMVAVIAVVVLEIVVAIVWASILAGNVMNDVVDSYPVS